MVGPVEGHYALTRDGTILNPDEFDLDFLSVYWRSQPHMRWENDGTAFDRHTNEAIPELDIVATISPEDMLEVANGALQKKDSDIDRKDNAIKQTLKTLYHCVEFTGTSDFDPEIKALEQSLKELDND